MEIVNTAAHIVEISHYLVQYYSFDREKKVKISTMVYSNEEQVFIIEHYFRMSFKRV